MSVLLTYQKLNKDKAWVDGIHYKRNDGSSFTKSNLTAKEKKNTYLINDESEIPPAPPEQRGKSNLLMINLNTNELYWETVDRPLTQEEAIQELCEKLDVMIQQQSELIELLKK